MEKQPKSAQAYIWQIKCIQATTQYNIPLMISNSFLYNFKITVDTPIQTQLYS